MTGYIYMVFLDFNRIQDTCLDNALNNVISPFFHILSIRYILIISGSY